MPRARHVPCVRPRARRVRRHVGRALGAGAAGTSAAGELEGAYEARFSHHFARSARICPRHVRIARVGYARRLIGALLRRLKPHRYGPPVGIARTADPLEPIRRPAEFSDYYGKWIAEKDGRVVAFADTSRQLVYEVPTSWASGAVVQSSSSCLRRRRASWSESGSSSRTLPQVPIPGRGRVPTRG